MKCRNEQRRSKERALLALRDGPDEDVLVNFFQIVNTFHNFGLVGEEEGPFSHMGVSKNSDTPTSSILIGFSILYHPFWGTPIFGNTHMFMAFMVYA